MNCCYIVAEDSIGSGKSELSHRLTKHFEASCLTENPEHSPFLEQFYPNTSNHGLATELFFLMCRAEDVDTISTEEDEDGRIIVDFSLEKDQIFVPAALKGPEQTLFWELRHKIMSQYPVLDLVMYLQTSGETGTEHLQRRGDGILSMFPSGYLGEIQQEYNRFFHLCQNTLLLIVNADGLDSAGSDEHSDTLFQAMDEMRGSRRYPNLCETV